MAQNIASSVLQIFVKIAGTQEAKAQSNSLTATITANQQKILEKEKQVAAARAALRTQKTTDPGVAAQREAIRLQNEELKKLKELERERQKAAAAAIKQNNALFQGLSASLARIASIVPANLPFANLAQSMLRATSASLGVANAMKGVGLNLSKVAVIAGAVIGGLLAIGAAFFAMAKGVKAAADSQEAVLGLSNALRTLGVHTQAAVNRATAFANSLQAVTKFSDEEILNTQALLAQLGRLTGEGLEKATRATLDLAAGLGRELPVATLIMAKAAQGSIFELRKYGLVVDENIPLTEKWAKVLEFVTENFGGRAQAELKGFNATARQFSGAFQDILTLVGAPIIIPLTDALGKVTRAMLDFAAARQQVTNERLLGAAPDIGKAFDDLIKAQERLAVARERAKIHPLEFSGVGIKAAENDLKRMEEALKGAINEMAKFGPMNDAIKTQAELFNRSRAALDAHAKALATNADNVEELRDKAWEALGIFQLFDKAFGQRLTLDAGQAQNAIDTIAESVRKVSEPIEVQMTFKNDAELRDLEERVNTLMATREFQVNMTSSVETADIESIKKRFENLKLNWELAIKSGNAENIVEAARAFRDAMLQAFSADQISVDKPQMVKAAKDAADFFRREVASQAPAFFQMRADKAAMEQVLTVVKKFNDSFKGDELKVFDPRMFEGVKTFDQALKLAHDSLLELFKLSPEQQIEAWRLLVGGISDVRTETEATRVAQEKWMTENLKFISLVIQAQEDLKNASKVQEVLEVKAPELKRQIRFLVNKGDIEAAQKLIPQLDALINEIPEEHTTQLKIDSAKFKKEIQDALDKTDALNRRISTRETIINLAIDTNNITLAMQQLELLRLELKNISDTDTKLELELKIKKLENEISDSQKTIDQFSENAKQEMKSITDSWTELPWEAAGELAGGVMQGLQDKTQSVAQTVVGIVRDMVNQIIAQFARLAVLEILKSFNPVAQAFDLAGLQTAGVGRKPSPPAEPEPTPIFPGKSVPQFPRPVRFEIPSVARQPLRFAAPAGVAFVPSAIQERFAQARGEHFAVSRGGLPSRRAVPITVNALDAQSIRRSLETGNLGKELARAVR